MNFVLASDSSLAGHPDKLCDRISDALVDACIADATPKSVVAECALASGVVFVALRHAGPLRIDPAAIARRVIAETGFPAGLIDAERATVIVDAARDDAMAASAPSRRAASSPRASAWAAAIGAGRPLGLGPDAPDPAEGERAVRAHATEILATIGLPDGPDAPLGMTLGRDARGSAAHAGLTGRTTADDGYGGFARQGTSALSGKDPSRIERSGAYAARQAALSVVAAGLARECEVQLCYAPGSAAPISIEIDAFGSGIEPDEAIAARLRAAFDFRAPAIAERLGLWTLPSDRGGRFYAEIAAYGHFGRRELDPPRERPEPGAIG